MWDWYGVTYGRTHLARILRANGIQYAKPRPMDPRQSADAEEDFCDRLGEALAKNNDSDPLVLGFSMQRGHNRSRTLNGCVRMTEQSRSTSR